MEKKYFTGVGHGFNVTKYSLEKLKSEHPELYEQFIESDYSFPMDIYHPNNTEYFFGIFIDKIYPGYIHQFSPLMLCDSKVYKGMMDEFRMYFPNWCDDNYIPRPFVMSCIE